MLFRSVPVRGLSLVATSGGHSSSRCAGLSQSRPLLLRSTGSRRTGSVVVAHGPSCSATCGIFPAQGSNPCPLHWQADSQPLRHQGSPINSFKATSQSRVGEGGRNRGTNSPEKREMSTSSQKATNIQCSLLSKDLEETRVSMLAQPLINWSF